MAVVSDKVIEVSSVSNASLPSAAIKRAALAAVYDYYLFGMLMPGRYSEDASDQLLPVTKTVWVPVVTGHYGGGTHQYLLYNDTVWKAENNYVVLQSKSDVFGKDYRFGFNGKQKDNEWAGLGNWQDYGMRMYDPRLGRFPSVDPLTAKYPFYTPYQFAGNTSIQAVDLDGAEELKVTGKAAKFYLQVLRVVNNSTVLTKLRTSISDPRKAGRILVYLTTHNSDRTGDNGETTSFNIKPAAVAFIATANKIANHEIVSSQEDQAYFEWSIRFNNWEIDPNEIAQAKQSEIYVVSVAENNPLNRGIKDLAHDVDAHLKDILDNGKDDKSSVDDHYSYYGIKKGSKAAKDASMDQNYSPIDPKVYGKGSRAETNENAVDQAMKKTTN